MGENICEVLCCKGQFQDHKGCPAPGAGGGGGNSLTRG